MKVKCRLCNKDFKQITGSHLKCKHNITIKNYKELYPNDILIPQEIKQKISNSFKDRIYTEEHRLNNSKARKKYFEKKLKKSLEILNTEIQIDELKRYTLENYLQKNELINFIFKKYSNISKSIITKYIDNHFEKGFFITNSLNKIKIQNILKRKERKKLLMKNIRQNINHNKINDLVFIYNFDISKIHFYCKEHNINEIKNKEILKIYLKEFGFYERCLLNAKCHQRRGAALGCINRKKTNLPRLHITQELLDLYFLLESKNIPNRVIKNHVCKFFNGKYGYKELFKRLLKQYPRSITFRNSGKWNGQWNKPAPKNSGIGIQGFIKINDKKVYFRSSLELKFYLYFLKTNQKFKSNLKSIKYINKKGIKRNYFPDILIDNCICEIKPSTLVDMFDNKEKIKYGKQYCKNNNLNFIVLTEKDLPEKFKTLKEIEIFNLKKEGVIIMNEKQWTRLIKILEK